jgi:hypothetical protein
MTSVPVKLERTSKVNVWTLFPTVGEPVPICPVPEISVPVGGAAQLTVNVAFVVAPAVTVTVWGLVLVTVQFAGCPESCTVYVAGGTLLKVVLPFGAIGWLAVPGVPLTVTV